MGNQRDVDLVTESGVVDLEWSDTGVIGYCAEAKEAIEMVEKTSLLDYVVVVVDANLLQLMATVRAVASRAIKREHDCVSATIG